jgi:hypothetical protein
MKRTLVMLHPKSRMRHVNIGFCWSALLLGPLWTLGNRLWLVSLLLLVALVFIVFIGEYALAQQSLALSVVALVFGVAYMYLCGRYGNAWRCWTLERRGYRLVDERPEF